MNDSMDNAVLQAIRTRRVIRALTSAPVAQEDLATVLDSARYAPHAGNRRLHKYIAVTRPALLHALRMVSPGMLQRPTAAIVICVDWAQVNGYGFAPANPGPYVDVGTAAATMMLAAHANGLGSGPVTSFSQVAVATVLSLPEPVRPELIICLGHPAAEQPPPMRRRNGTNWADVTQWNRG